MGLWVIVGHVISVWIEAGLGLADADREIHRLKIGFLLGMEILSVIFNHFLQSGCIVYVSTRILTSDEQRWSRTKANLRSIGREDSKHGRAKQSISGPGPQKSISISNSTAQ